MGFDAIMPPKGIKLRVKLSQFLLIITAICACTRTIIADGVCWCGGYPCQNANEYCDAVPEQGEYQCELCPSGQIPNNSCNGCVDAIPIPTHCTGYDDCPSGVGDANSKCKAIDGCPLSCQKYEICNTTNGAITTGISGNCHIEGNACYSNTRNCKDFPIDYFMAHGNDCEQNAQTGTAKWENNTWDTKNCACTVTARPVSFYNCQQTYIGFSVSDADRYETQTANNSVIYHVDYLYCTKCAPGWLPDSVNSPDDNGVIMRPVPPDGSWGVYQCKTKVSKPYFSTGCTIDFSTSALNVSNCQETCNTGLTITTDGATSANACIPDSTTYRDGTGTFTLGPDKCTP